MFNNRPIIYSDDIAVCRGDDDGSDDDDAPVTITTKCACGAQTVTTVATVVEPENTAQLRVAGEVFIFMHRNFRVSRNIRAHWLFDHLNKKVRIDPDSQKDEKYGNEMSVIGIVPKGGSPQEDVWDEDFVVNVDTKITYISRYYRHVYVLDLSPSTIVADDVSDCCLCTRLIKSLGDSMISAVKGFTVPGTTRMFQPQIYISVLVFVPFISFESDLVLVQGVLLTESNVSDVLATVKNRFQRVFHEYYKFVRPALQRWGRLKRRYKNYKFDSLCEPDDVLGAEEARAFDPRRRQRDEADARTRDQPENLMEFTRGQWRLYADAYDDLPQDASVDGYVLPEWSLVFMLRLGLLATQMLPENTQSNVIIITDAVCGMPDSAALQRVLTQLRSYTIACSFIQLQARSSSEPVFGHVASCELLHFLAMATFGTYLPNCGCVQGADGVGETEHVEDFQTLDEASDEDSETNELHDLAEVDEDEEPLAKGMKSELETARNEPQPREFEPLNSFHRALICWCFQNALSDNEHITKTIFKINPVFAELHKQGVGRHCQLSTTYRSTLHQLLYVRLREGFTLKAASFADNGRQITVVLCLPFRPLVFVEYIIQSPWPAKRFERCDMHVELIIQAPFNELKNLLIEGPYLDPTRVPQNKSIVDSIIEADRLLMHIHSFNMDIDFYSIPSGVTINYALFNVNDRIVTRQTNSCLTYLMPNELKTTRRFLAFWRVLLDLNDATWQKWVHTHSERLVLNVDVPFNVFNCQESFVLNLEEAVKALRGLVKLCSSFCLINGFTYVTFSYPDNPVKTTHDGELLADVQRGASNHGRPDFFYMTRLSSDKTAAIVLKTAFLGGISTTIRRKTVDDLRNKLMRLTYDDDPERPVLSIIRRPLERILVKYSEMPADLRTITRVHEDTDNEDEVKHIIMHNALSKCLKCKRTVVVLADLQVAGGAFESRLAADLALNVILKRRLADGYKPVWVQNNIVGLCRQVCTTNGNALEQYVLFPPSTITLPLLRHRARLGTHHDSRRVNLRPPFSSTRALAIVTEYWSEPGGDIDHPETNVENEEKSHPRYQATPSLEDNDVVSLLYTVDRLLRVCGDVDDATATRVAVGERRDGQVLLDADGRDYFSRLVAPDPDDDDALPEDKTAVDAAKSVFAEWRRWDDDFVAMPCYKHELSPRSKYVNVYKQMLCPANLFQFTPRHLLTIGPFCTDPTNKEAAQVMLETVIDELEAFSDAWFNVMNPHLWPILTRRAARDNKDEKIYKHKTKRKCRLFLRRVSPWAFGLIAVPETVDDLHDGKLPIAVHICCEPQLAYCVAMNQFQRGNLRPLDKIPVEWFVKTRCRPNSVWADTNAEDGKAFEAMTLAGFLKMVREEVVSRTRIQTIFSLCRRRIEVLESETREMQEDAYIIDMEMESVPNALRTFCRHLQDSGEPESDNCADKTNLPDMFEQVVGRSFSHVPGAPTIYYCDYKLTSEDRKRVRRRQKKEARLDEKRRRQRETREREKKERELDMERAKAERDSPDYDETKGWAEEKRRMDEEEKRKQRMEKRKMKKQRRRRDLAPRRQSLSRRSLTNTSEGDESPLVSRQVDDESDDEWDVRREPLFLQFQCTLKFPDGVSETFALDTMPACVNQLLARSRHKAERDRLWHEATDVVMDTIDVERRRIEEVKRTRSAKQEVLDVDDEKSHRRNVFLIDAVTCVDDEDDELRRPYWLDMRELDVCLEIVVVTQKPLTERGLILKKTTSHGKKKKRLLQQTSSSSDDPLLTLVNDDANFYNRLLNNDAVSDSGDSFFSTTSWASCASINSDIGDDVPWPSEYEYTSSSEDLDDERDVPSTSSSRPNEEHEHHHHHRRRRRRVSHRRRRGDEKPPYVDLAQVSDAKLYALAKAIASHLVVGGLPEVHRCTKLSGDDSDCDDYVTAIERTKAFHAYLPKKESVELKSLVSSLNGLMEMERVLVRSRNCDITIEMLSQISSFISKEVKKGHGVVRMVERSKPIVLVMCTEAAELRLLELLDGARMNFAKLVRCGDSPIYYCSRVDDVDACITSYRQRTTTAATTTTTQPMAQNEYAFDYTEDDEELREKGRHERGSQTKKLVEQMVAQELRRRVGKAKMKQMAAAAVQGNAAVDVQMANDDKLGTAQKDVLFDFWLILTVKQTFNMQFCQRYEAHQSALPQAVWDKCRSALRVVNQELLLDRLYETRWCDPLLLPVDEDERVRIQRPYSMATVMNNDDDAENDDDDGSKATTSTTTTLIRRKDDSSDDSGKNDDDDDDDDDDESDDTDTDSDRASVLRLCAVTTKLPSSTPPAAFVDTYGECDDYRDDLGPPISDLARYTYSPGHFACMAKAHLWFTVPPRLRANNSPVSSSTSSTSALSSSLQFAYDSLRPALEQFAVRNIPNMYVVKDDDTGDVMYMMLHIRPETYVASICMQQVPPTATHLEYVARRMERDILMTIFGVRRPSVAIAKQLRDAVQKRLEYVLLQNMLTLFAKNSSMRLLAHDVQFLQRDVMQPSLMKFFSIPALFKGHLASFLYYVHQHMQVIMTIAKLRDDFSLVGGTRGPKAGPPCRLKSYPAPKGKMPAKYTPTFFLYVKVPKSGSADYGVAIVEIRVVNQDGTIAVSLPEGRNNSETHKLLARPLPASARNKYFRVITKTHKAEAPEKWACDVCGYLQVVAWKVGVLQLDLLEDALQQVAEVALCDVVTEFGFLNAAIIESGASVPPSPRAAPIQTQRLSAKLSSPAEARSSLGHKRDSHDLQPPPTPQAKTGIFTFDTSAVRMSTSSAAAGGSGGGQIVARRGSTASELDKLAIREELTRDAPREPDFVSLRTATTLCEWFEFCASKAGDTNAVFADTIAFDCPSSALPTLLEIRRAIANELGTVETMRENVYLCTWAAGDSRHGSTTSTSTSTTMTTSTTTTTTNIVDGRFECIQSAQPGCLSGDYGVISTTVHPIEHVMVSFIKEVAVETLRFGFDPVGDTPDMLKRLHEYPSALFAPLTEERSFVPRQRMMFAVMRGASFTMYFYNFHPSVSDRIRHIARMALLWHNARTRLLREIGLHKMGITHLSPLLPGGQNTYETLVWTDPGKLINTDYPPEEVRMPEFSQLPVEYSNYLFRLYRRPYGMDANEKPAKRMRHPKMRCPETSTPHQRRQDCLVSSTFDQMLRLRQRVADRLNTVRKATALHNHFLNGNNDIEEEDTSTETPTSNSTLTVAGPESFFYRWRIFRMLHYGSSRRRTSSPGGGSRKLIDFICCQQ